MLEQQGMNTMSLQQNHKCMYRLWIELIGKLCKAEPMAIALLALFIAQPVTALEQVDDFGENPGNLQMFLHRPAAFRQNLPLLVALHGCRQRAADFDNETGLTALAQQIPFLLLLPQQRETNMARACFRWYDTDDNLPGRGESASILAMIDNAIDNEGVNPARVYVLGLSAGGAMTAVLLSNYPDRFAGGAIFAGLPYGCNRSAGFSDFTWNWLHYSPLALDGADASYACGIAGFRAGDRDGKAWSNYVRKSADSLPESWPLLSLWQGTDDSTVDPDNLDELTKQWTSVQGIDTLADDEEVLSDATRKVYKDEAGNPRVETWLLKGFGHAVPIDVDSDVGECGEAGGYVSDAGVCAVRRVAEFWGLR